MEPFAKLLASILAFFYELIPNYAIAIGLLTLVVMVALLPLTIKGTRSMLAMQKLAPEIKKLQDKHKNDRQKLNEEVMAVYRDNKINPLGGCLPLLLQLPVFLVLYQVINGLTHKATQVVPGVNGLPDTSTIVSAPKHLDKGSELYQALVNHGGAMKSFGVDLAQSANDKHATFAAAIPFFALIIIMVVAQYYQQHQVSSRTPSSSDTAQARQLRMVQKFYPPFFGLISLGFPAALVLYWVLQTAFRVVQQWAMYRFDPLLKTTVESATKEARSFLKDDKDSGRATKPKNESGGSTKSSNNKNSKKNKGR